MTGVSTQSQGALQAPRSHQQFPLFDSLRALAAISILVVHVTIFSGVYGNSWFAPYVAHLDIGVPFFFLLSAFLLYRPFVAARIAGTDQGSLLTYARRRFIRIMPAYWAVLTISAVIPGMAGAFSGNWWVYYGLLQNYPVYTREGECAVDAFRCSVPPAWSLAVEVMFYAVLPLFALLAAWLGRRWKGRNWLVPELALIGLIGLVSIWIQTWFPGRDVEKWLFFSPLGRGWWFGIGLALAAVSVRLTEGGGMASRPKVARRRGWAELSAVTGIALYVLACAFLLDPTPSLAFPFFVDPNLYVFECVLVGVIAALIVLPAIFDRDGGGPYRRILANRTLTWLGLISYGIFLWQFPVIIGLVDLGVVDGSGGWDFPVLLATTFVGTVICATLSYYLLELPLMRRFRSGPSPAASGPGGELKRAAVADPGR